MSPTRKLVFAGLVTATLCLPVTAAAQNITAFPVATDFSAQDAVLELDVASHLDGASFLIVWVTPAGQYSRTSHARAGKHSYEMRDNPEWRGQIKVLAITMRGVPARTKKPELSDELDMFLKPERIGPATINLLVGHTLFGRSWNTVLLFTLLISTVLFAKFKRTSLVHSAALGFVVACGVMEFRSIYDHTVVVYKREAQQQGMFPLADVKLFADQAAGLIGRSSWGHTALDWPVRTFLPYRLAEQKFVSSGSSSPPAFQFTKDPGEGQVMLTLPDPVAASNHYLVKKSQP